MIPGMSRNPFGTRGTFDVQGTRIALYRLGGLEKAGIGPALMSLPCSIKVLIEAALRRCDGFAVTEKDIEALARWQPEPKERPEIPFLPARVILQDFTGVPVVTDLAAMRAAVDRLGQDPSWINPIVPVDLV